MISKEIEKNISLLLDKLKAEFSAESVPVIAEEGIIDSCYYNVSRKIAKDGGKIHYGWAIWYRPYMIEAEHHAVWENEHGDLLDISPREKNVNTIIFVSDNKRTYTGNTIFNIRLNTTKNPLVDDLIIAKDAHDKIFSYGKRLNEKEVSLPNFAINMITQLKTIANNIELFILQENTFGSKCYCNSGLKYSQCHRKDLLAFSERNLLNIKKQITNLNQTY